MSILNLIPGIIKPAVDGFFRWKEGEDKMEVSRQDYELRLKQLEAEIQLKLSEEMRKPDSEFRKFVMDYEGAAKDQTTFIKNLRSSVRPFITYWALIIITVVMFGLVDGDMLQKNLNAIPPQLWQIFLAIFGFWFGGRALMQVAETWKAGDIRKQQVESDARAAEAHVNAKATVKKAAIEKEHKVAELQIAQAEVKKSPKPAKKEKPKEEMSDDEYWDTDW